MFDNLTYKQKTWLLVISSSILLFIGYKVAIIPTFKIQSSISLKQSKIEKAKTAQVDILKAQSQLTQLKTKVGKTSETFELFQKEILNSVVPFAKENDVLINEIKHPHKASKNGYEVQTLQIECRGGFSNLTKLLNHIQKENIGRVCSVHYELRKDYKLKRRFLYATLFIQNYLVE